MAKSGRGKYDLLAPGAPGGYNRAQNGGITVSDIADHIKELRKEKGLSQEQLAQLLHVTRQTVSAWERDRAQPSLDTLRQIAGALQVEEERLLYGGKGGRRPRYRKVSFWPILGILPLWYVGILLIMWVLDALLGARGDAGILLSGQIFWGLVLMFCYCCLKDEICNQAFYRAADEDRERREQEGNGEEPDR